MVDLSRRAMLGAIGLGIVGTAVSWPRLTARDIPGRGEDALTITVFGTAQDAVQRQGLVDGFQKLHPDIPVRIVAVQGQDWGSYFAKILTMVAAGTPPDVVTTATEGTQLFASRMAYPIDEFVQRDAADGFILVPHLTPAGLDEFVDRVVPLLQERGVFRTEYKGTTLRSHLGLCEPVWKG